ncbi:DUF3887 domain-containing protein [Streptomyces sp. NPDC093225]|uniref:DUF3887 domain-containing protein n=1 Tax=Streptomyces sp. NPDC093225 TaxID=3366034 RepID=UPI0037FD3AEF
MSTGGTGVAAEAHSAAAAAGPAAVAADTRFDRIAVQSLDDIVAGDFVAASARFSPTMRRALSPEALSRAWQTCQDVFGDYRSHGDPRDVTVGALTAVDIPMEMSQSPAALRFVFQQDGSIAGLWCLAPGTPVT